MVACDRVQAGLFRQMRPALGRTRFASCSMLSCAAVRCAEDTPSRSNCKQDFGLTLKKKRSWHVPLHPEVPGKQLHIPSSKTLPLPAEHFEIFTPLALLTRSTYSYPRDSKAGLEPMILRHVAVDTLLLNPEQDARESC